MHTRAETQLNEGPSGESRRSPWMPRLARGVVLLGVAWLGGMALGKLRPPSGPDMFLGPEGAERLRERLVDRVPSQAFFASGFGRQLLEDSERQAVAVMFVQWSECLSCAAEMVEWADESRRAPTVRSVEVLTRRLPPDVGKFLAETAASVPIHVDSLLVAADVAPMLPLILLIKDRTVRIAYVGKGWAWRFWADVHQLTADPAVADGR